MSDNPRSSIDRDLAATTSLALYSLAVAFGFVRVFSGWSFMPQLALIVVVGHGASLVMRRARVSGWIAVPAMSLLLIYALLALRYPSTFAFGLPTGSTLELLDLELSLVREQFPTEIAPVIYGTGWATLALFAVAVAVVMADTFAFRAEARGEALVPGGVLFVFIAALGDERLRILSTAMLIGAGIVAVVGLRAYHDRSRRIELTSRRTRSFLLPTAIASAVVVAVLAGFVGPRLPGAEADAIYDTGGRNEGATQIQPLVDIRPSLTNQGNVELFRIRADEPAYWRVVTVPEFDGRRFRVPRRDLLPLDEVCSPDGRTVARQNIQIIALTGILIPAAAEPCRAEGFSGGAELRLGTDRQSGTLSSPQEVQAGDLFTVESLRRDLTPEILRSATSVAPPDPIFTELPDDLPEVVAETAAAWTAGATTSYDQAIALQTEFRTFEYSTDVSAGHSNNAIESFLNERIGYCEQFSATFAAMARTLGIPSRVAVGYTPGVRNEDGWFSVLGKNAHAWPELWFDGIGWVSFEPTPTRGEPGATAYTDVEPEQDESGQTGTGAGAGAGGSGTGETLPTTPPAETVPATTVPNEATDTTNPEDPTILPNFGDDPGNIFQDEIDAAGGTTSSDSNPIPWVPISIAALIALALAGPELIRRWRRRATSQLEPEERVTAAWRRARGAAEEAGVHASSAMTPAEVADATARQLPVAARPMASLAAVVDRVTFAPPGSLDLEKAGAYGSTLRHDCELWAHQVDRIAHDQYSTRQRLRSYFFDLD